MNKKIKNYLDGGGSKPILIHRLSFALTNITGGDKHMLGIYECPSCDKEYTAKISAVDSGRNNKCSSCGNIHHRLRDTKIYGVWDGMKQRCKNVKHSAYVNYGGRGVSVCDEWNNSFTSFFEWALANGYREGLTIDRKDNDGNYNPSNCRFSSRTIQARNTRVLPKNNTSGYRGVSFNSVNKKWFAQIMINYKNISLGTFTNPFCAGMEYDAYVVEHNLEHATNIQPTGGVPSIM